MRSGIDISKWNGVIDWSNINTDFVYIKCNTGVNSVDSQLLDNAKGAHDKCIDKGYYHWATLKTFDVVKDAKEEAQEFIHYLQTLPVFQLPPVLDFEEENLLKFPPELMQLWILTFYSELKKAKFNMVLYSYVPYLNDNLPNNHICGHIPLWIASYPFDKKSNVGPNHEVLGYANIPLNFEYNVPYPPKGWRPDDIFMWQYTGQGKIDGIPGHVDKNIKF